MRNIELYEDKVQCDIPLLTDKEKQAITRKFNNSKKYLENFAKYTKMVSDIEELEEYLDKAIENGVLSIDTETTGLDPKRDKILGISLHTFSNKDFTKTQAVYVPINHLLLNNEPNPANINLSSLIKAFSDRDFSDIEIMMFNMVFDTRVILNGLGIYLPATFDAYIASRLLNENEASHSLKTLYDKYVARDGVPKQTFNNLFDVKHFKYAPLNLATWYAGFDAFMTSGLYLYQKQFLGGEYTKRYHLEDIAKVFYEIEMPVQEVIVKIEENGMELDRHFNAYLLVRKQEELEVLLEQWYKEIEPYKADMDAYRVKYDLMKSSGKDVRYKKLDNPINLNSSHQLKILYYEIIGETSYDKVLSTDADHLERFKHKSAKTLLEYRNRKKIISTYIGKFPEIAHEDDRIRSKFNSVGADTMRFTSKDINF